MKQYSLRVIFNDGDEFTIRVDEEKKQDLIEHYLGKSFPYFIHGDKGDIKRFHTAINVEVQEI